MKVRRAVVLATTALLALVPGRPLAAQQDSLSLGGWLALARGNSPAIAAAAAGVREAEGLRSAARSRRGPRLEALLTYLRFQDPPVASLGSLGTYAPILENNYLGELSVSQPLYTFGRIAAGVRAAEWNARAAELSTAEADVAISAAVAHAYDDVLLARALREVALQSVEVLEEAVRVAREHYEAGTVARLDVLRAETRLSSARSQLRASEVTAVTAAERLAVLAGVNPDSAPPIAGSLQHVPVSVELDSLLLRAPLARPDVQALHAQARAGQAEADAARASRLPALSLYAMTFASRPEFISGLERWGWELLGGVSIKWSLFDSGEAVGLARTAEAAADRAEAEATRAVDAAVAEVRAQARELERAAADVDAGQVNVTRAERALEIAQDRYISGVGTQLEVLEVERDLSGARVDLLEALHAHRSALIELKRSAGLPADAPLPGAQLER